MWHQTKAVNLEIRRVYKNNSIIEYLIINSLRNQITNLREIIDRAPLKETKLDESFQLKNHQFPSFRRDQISKGYGKKVFMIENLIVKDSESI